MTSRSSVFAPFVHACWILNFEFDALFGIHPNDNAAAKNGTAQKHMSPQDAFWKTNRGSRTLSLGRTPEHRRRIVCSLRNSMPWILHDPSYPKQFVLIFTAGKGSKIHKSRSVTFYLPNTQFFFNFKDLFLVVR